MGYRQRIEELQELLQEGAEISAGQNVSYIIQHGHKGPQKCVIPSELINGQIRYDIEKYTQLLLDTVKALLPYENSFNRLFPLSRVSGRDYNVFSRWRKDQKTTRNRQERTRISPNNAIHYVRICPAISLNCSSLIIPRALSLMAICFIVANA
jgi:hypothetical protein